MSVSQFDTHEIFNQSSTFENANLFETDAGLKDAVAREGASAFVDDLSAFGRKVGTAEALELGRQANVHKPILNTLDKFGQRSDTIEFHPAYHSVMAMSVEAGIHAQGFEDDAPAGSSVARGAKHLMMSQIESGHVCPITMTYAAIPTLKIEPSIAKNWLPKILTREYDGSFRPVPEKSGATIGMGMTESQGGTDVRSNTTRAEPVRESGPGKQYLIHGHKWFMSAPMCDAFLVLAQAPGGLSVFLVPRFKPSGEVNEIHFMRLKEKLGNCSNASSEVQFHNAYGELIGEEGRGIANIMVMANLTRIDCALGSAGLMRQALVQAINHARGRRVFQKTLVDQPAMTGVLADLALESEAATALAMRLTGAQGRERTSKSEEAYLRLMTPVIKYWVTKRGPNFAYEAMEVFGGNGYVETGMMSRIYRDIPVNSIWEGAGSVMCLDVLRVLARNPNSARLVMEEFSDLKGRHPDYDQKFETVLEQLQQPTEATCRSLTENLAKLAAASIFLKAGQEEVSDAYIASRLSNAGGDCYGTMPDSIDTRALVARALPA